MQLRPATASDAASIAALHADSWRRHYRGAYADAYLDGDVDDDLLGIWAARLGTHDPATATVMACEDDALVGFVHTVLDADATYGALLDNLHVRHDRHRSGLGTRLMASSADTVVRARPGQRIHLWVLQQNVRARSFYDARGGVCAGSQRSEVPGGTTVVGLRYVWDDPSVLLTA